MITSMLALASTGVSGSGAVDVPPRACAAALPSLLAPVAGADGTRVPAAGLSRLRGTEVLGFAAATTRQHDPITQNDGTTPLGIHSPGRPKS